MTSGLRWVFFCNLLGFFSSVFGLWVISTRLLPRPCPPHVPSQVIDANKTVLTRSREVLLILLQLLILLLQFSDASIERVSVYCVN